MRRLVALRGSVDTFFFKCHSDPAAFHWVQDPPYRLIGSQTSCVRVANIHNLEAYVLGWLIPTALYNASFRLLEIPDTDHGEIGRLNDVVYKPYDSLELPSMTRSLTT
jgi:hypothetical protein